MIDPGVGSVTVSDGERYVLTPKGVKGHAIFGPYVYVDPGEHVVEFGLCDAEPDEENTEAIAAVIDVNANYGESRLASADIRANALRKGSLTLFRLAFRVTRRAALEFRVRTTGERDLAIRLRRRLIHGGKVTDFPPQDPSGLQGAALSEARPSTDVGWLTRRRVYSKYVGLDRAVIEADGRIPMFWVTGDAQTSFGNFGDALSPVVVAALSGRDSVGVPRNGQVRLLTSGTVLSWQQRGYAHVWGTGLDPGVDSFLQPAPHGYKMPPDLKLRIHAVRGALTRKALQAVGVECPPVFGDPGWLLPRIVPPATEKTCELGIIPHMSEFETQTSDSRVLERLKRYDIGGETSIKIISTRHPPTWEGFVDKIREITACRRIISTSFHGLIVPQAYGVPAMLFFKRGNDGLVTGALSDDASDIDHRVRDFMLGAGHSALPMYGRYSEERTNWDDVVKAIDSSWEPLIIDTDPFVEAFPLNALPPGERWKISDQRTAQIYF